MAEVLARAFWIAAPRVGEIRDERVAAPSGGEVLVRALYSGISRGTESLVFHGRVPPSEFQRMRAPFQDGEFPSPIKYGYASVGLVEDGADDLRGRHVFVLYPHQTRYAVPSRAVHVLPDGVPPQRAVLAANLETAINVLWDARPHIGDRISIVGAGTVGCLAGWIAGRIAGCNVELVDVNPRRADVARTLGVGFAAPERAAENADVVIHASGSPSGLDLSLRLAGFESAIIDASWYGDAPVAAALGGPFHARRLTLRATGPRTASIVARLKAEAQPAPSAQDAERAS